MQSNIATVLSGQADATARTQMKSIQNVANVLASMMEDMHGGAWRVDANHEANSSFVLIRPVSEQAISKPKRGEVV